MRTYSHFIITATASQVLDISILNKRALLLGAVFPDFPLTLLTVGYFVMQKFGKPNGRRSTDQEFQNIRCTDPVWVISYNFFHAPLILLALGWMGFIWGIRRNHLLGQLLFWFVIGCGFHSAIDIVTHHDDGPLIFFPLDWQTRINSQISYWDKNHRGNLFTVMEHLIDVLLAIHLISN